MELHQLMVGGKVDTSLPPKSWDSIARRYVEHDTLPEQTFGEFAPQATEQLADVRESIIGNIATAITGKPANDNVPKRDWNENLPRAGDWMQTFTGRQFWPMDPRADEVFIEDIAHALSMQCRYAGHCLKFYSVAEHSDHLAWWLYERYGAAVALWGLMHDASEAYLVDVPRPVKPFLAGYKPAEAKVMAVICERFGLPPEMPKVVHEADHDIIADERANMAPCVAKWAGGYDKPLGVSLQYWAPAMAERAFLVSFEYFVRKAARAAA